LGKRKHQQRWLPEHNRPLRMNMCHNSSHLYKSSLFSTLILNSSSIPVFKYSSIHTFFWFQFTVQELSSEIWLYTYIHSTEALLKTEAVNSKQW
jgi:hypothetical protein